MNKNIKNEFTYNNDGESYEDLELDRWYRDYLNMNVFVNGFDDYIYEDQENFLNLTTIREIQLLKEFGYLN